MQTYEEVCCYESLMEFGFHRRRRGRLGQEIVNPTLQRLVAVFLSHKGGLRDQHGAAEIAVIVRCVNRNPRDEELEIRHFVIRNEYHPPSSE